MTSLKENNLSKMSVYSEFQWFNHLILSLELTPRVWELVRQYGKFQVVVNDNGDLVKQVWSES